MKRAKTEQEQDGGEKKQTIVILNAFNVASMDIIKVTVQRIRVAGNKLIQLWWQQC